MSLMHLLLSFLPQLILWNAAECHGLQCLILILQDVSSLVSAISLQDAVFCLDSEAATKLPEARFHVYENVAAHAMTAAVRQRATT